MDHVVTWFGPPAELEAALVFGYVFLVLSGARVVEVLARVHFARGRRLMEHGFTYVTEEDHYLCREGERLPLHLVEKKSRVAVYRAPASRCNDCAHKGSCTPHDEGRHIYRPLAAWAETDLGRFHHRLALLMFSVGAILSLFGLFRWGGESGTGWLMLAFLACLGATVRDLRALRSN